MLHYAMCYTPEESADGVPEANAYEFQSGGVVALLEKLRLKFQEYCIV